MLNTRDEQHTLSQPTRRRANTANGKEGLKHASTLRYIQNTGQGQRGEDMLRPRSKAMRAEMQQHTESMLIQVLSDNRGSVLLTSQFDDGNGKVWSKDSFMI